MNVTDPKDALFAALRDDPASADLATAFVATLRHDLGNLIGTFTMEFHILGQLVDQLRMAALRQDSAGILRQVDDLADIQVNLTEAGTRARELLGQLRLESEDPS